VRVDADAILASIRVRLVELEPVVEEYRDLAVAHLDLPPPRRAPRDWRRHALALIHEQPGVTIPQIALEIGGRIKWNQLYMLLPGLAGEGLVVRRGRRWYPAGWLEASPIGRERIEGRYRRPGHPPGFR
jgi:hypothetical protein